MQKVNILFLGGAKRVSMGERFISAGKRLGLNVNLFSYELNDEVPIREIATIIKGGFWSDENACNQIEKAISEHEIDVVVPFVDPATILAAQIQSSINTCFVSGADASVARLFYNKREAQQWFVDNSVPVPVFTGVFPAIAKPVFGSASSGIRVLQNKEEMDFFFQHHEEKEYLVQRYITGEEYSVDCYIEGDGSIIGVVPRLRIQVAGGEVIKSKTVEYLGLVDLSEQIIRRSGLKGPACIQVIKEQETRKIFLIEVNPRFGGGVVASIEAGADMPYFLLNEYLGNKNDPVTNWQRGLLMMRAHREYFKK